jgi:hypothetical protein
VVGIVVAVVVVLPVVVVVPFVLWGTVEVLMVWLRVPLSLVGMIVTILKV